MGCILLLGRLTLLFFGILLVLILTNRTCNSRNLVCHCRLVTKEGDRLGLRLKLCHIYGHSSNLTPTLRGSWPTGAITPSAYVTKWLRSYHRRRVPAEMETHLTNKGK